MKDELQLYCILFFPFTDIQHFNVLNPQINIPQVNSTHATGANQNQTACHWCLIMATLLANFGFSPKNNEWLCQD
jgi:hypothetical protein